MKRLVIAALVMHLAVVGCRSRKLPHEGKSVAELERMLATAIRVPRRKERWAGSAWGRGRAGGPALFDGWRARTLWCDKQCALALGKIGPAARSAVPGLMRALNDPEWAVRRQAAVALGEIGPAPPRRCRSWSFFGATKAPWSAGRGGGPAQCQG